MRSFLGPIAVVMLVSGCGDDGGSASPDVSLVEPDTLTVCSDIPYAPFEFVDAEGRDTGFDLDLLTEVADRNELELAVLDRPFPGIFDDLDAGVCDVVASAVTITAEREELVDFTRPYFDADQSLLVRVADRAAFATLGGLAGQRIGVQGETTGEQYATEHLPTGAEIVRFEDSDAMFAALASGDVAALLQDFPVNAFRAIEDSSFVVTETFPTGEQYGFAVREGADGVKELLDDGIDALRADGTFNEIFGRYFGEPA